MSRSTTSQFKPDPSQSVSVADLDAEVERALEGAMPRHDADAEDLQRRIAQAAYGRAEARGFSPGRELDDWLGAEREVRGQHRG